MAEINSLNFEGARVPTIVKVVGASSADRSKDMIIRLRVEGGGLDGQGRPYSTHLVFGAAAEQTTMTKVEAIIQVSKLEAVKDALHEVGVEGMTVFEARGHGRQKGHTEFYRGREYTVDLIPKVKLEIVLADDLVEKAVQAITTAARTGKIGDGKIFLSRIDEAIRIRNDERGESVL
jgi:nitrogen regulatory protein P-II 1